jgi:hypothetical protein
VMFYTALPLFWLVNTAFYLFCKKCYMSWSSTFVMVYGNLCIRTSIMLFSQDQSRLFIFSLPLVWHLYTAAEMHAF